MTLNTPKYAHVFVDTSNTWIGGQRTRAATRNLRTPSDPSWRLNARALFATVEREMGVVIHSRHLFCSEMTDNPRDGVWRKFREDVDVVNVNYRSPYTRKEVDVDKRLSTAVARLADALTYFRSTIVTEADLARFRGTDAFEHFARVLLLDSALCTLEQVSDVANNSVIVLVLGDGGFAQDVEDIATLNKVPVALWSWTCTYSALRFGAVMAKGVKLAHYVLDPFINEVGFNAKFNVKAQRIPPASAVVFPSAGGSVPVSVEDMLRRVALPYYSHAEPNGDVVVIVASVPSNTTMAACVEEILEHARCGFGEWPPAWPSALPFPEYCDALAADGAGFCAGLGGGPSAFGAPTHNVYGALSDVASAVATDAADSEGEERSGMQSLSTSSIDSSTWSAEPAWDAVGAATQSPVALPKKPHHKIQCAYRRYCQNVHTKAGCEYYHTDEELALLRQHGAPRLRKTRLCATHPNCLKSAAACNFAHGTEDLFCPTCEGRGHSMDTCSQRALAAPDTRVFLGGHAMRNLADDGKSPHGFVSSADRTHCVPRYLMAPTAAHFRRLVRFY